MSESANHPSNFKEKNIPIQICNINSTRGELSPRWFRFEDEEHQIRLIQVNSVVSQKEIDFVGMKMIQFICKVGEGTESDKEHLVELRYHIMTHRWTLFQILS